MAEVLFCTVCDNSVPVAELESGDAHRLDERVVCATCRKLLQPAAAARGGGGGALGAILAVFALGGAGWVWWDSDQANLGLRSEINTALATQKTDSNARLVGQKREIITELENSQGLTRTQLSTLGDRLSRLEESLTAQFDEVQNDLERLDSLAEDLSSASQTLEQVEAGVSLVGERQRDQRGTLESLRDQVDLVDTRLAALEARGPASAEGGGIEFAPKITALLRQLTSDDQDKRLDALEKLSGQQDERLVPHLLPLLTDPYEFNRFYAAKTLGDWRSKASVPHLIEALLDEISFVRQAAVQSLRQTSGQNFRYDHQAEEGERQKAYEQWKTWWAANGKAFLEE